jgi:hypothetical protein
MCRSVNKINQRYLNIFYFPQFEEMEDERQKEAKLIR